MSKILPIITNPNPILRKQSKEIKKDEIKSKQFQGLCFDMEKTMKKKDGAGLASPQIGKNIRLIVVNSDEGVIHMINPKITKKSFAKEFGEEGCLSIPDIFLKIERHKKVNCKYLDLNGNEKKIKASGMLARIIQHEVDHLDGILFIDYEKN